MHTYCHKRKHIENTGDYNKNCIKKMREFHFTDKNEKCINDTDEAINY